MGDETSEGGDKPRQTITVKEALELMVHEDILLKRREHEAARREAEHYTPLSEDCDCTALTAERDALAQRVKELTAALGYIAGWTPGTFENDGAAYNSGVMETASRYRALAREALKK